MSLTSHLAHKGAVSTWMREQFPIAARLPVVRSCRPTLREATTLLPPREQASGEPYPYGTLGTALDYRLRLYFGPFPPDIVAHQGAWIVTRGSYEHPDILPDNPISPLRPGAEHESGVPIAVIARFFADFEEAVIRLAPFGRLLTEDDEEELARYCVVLAHWDAILRAGMSINSPLLGTDAPRSVAELLELCAPAMTRDLGALSRLFFERCPDLVALGGAVVQNPTFVGSRLIGGADADFIAGRYLWEIKSTIKPFFQGEWLYQLLGYVLLDFNDAHAIREVGVYLARQGLCFRWPLAELLETISASGGGTLPVETRLERLRAEFRALLEKEMEAEMAQKSARIAQLVEQQKALRAEHRAGQEAAEAEIVLAAEHKKVVGKPCRQFKKRQSAPSTPATDS